MDERFQVAVVGAGPAGCAAAITLARAGVPVVLLDKARFPREKCCGDGLTTGALRRLEHLGVAVPDLASFVAIDSLHVRSPSGRVVAVPLSLGGRRSRPGLRAGVVRRSDLDAALVAAAREAGAELFEGDALDSVDSAPNGPVRVRLKGGRELAVNAVIGADGAWSPLRRMLEPAGPPRHQSAADWHAYRAYADRVSGPAASELWVWFPEALLPGYAWSFPLPGGQANVGICLPRGDKASGAGLAKRWRAFTESPLLASLIGEAAVLEPVRSWPIPAAMMPERLSALGGRVLFCGDAAGAADPFSGEGIAQGLETGIAAGAALAAERADPPGAASRYRKEMAATLCREQRLARVCRALMARPLGARGAVRVTGANDWTLRNFGRWLYEDFPRTLALSPRQWRPGVLSHPPPFEAAAPAPAVPLEAR